MNQRFIHRFISLCADDTVWMIKYSKELQPMINFVEKKNCKEENLKINVQTKKK